MRHNDDWNDVRESWIQLYLVYYDNGGKKRRFSPLLQDGPFPKRIREENVGKTGLFPTPVY
jgi:hypothetical protein